MENKNYELEQLASGWMSLYREIKKSGKIKSY